MHVSISWMNNLHAMRPDSLARVLEERGFESLWIGEHAHLPVNSGSPYPDGKLPPYYLHMADMFVALSYAAAVTKKLKLGTGVALVLERDVFNMAKAVATLDQLSNGRVMLGFGVGWNQKELENVSKVPWKRRYSGMKDCAMALKALWTQEEAEYHGEFVDFGPSWSWPKPAVPVPVIIGGGAGPKMFAHIAEYAQGWIPIGGAGLTTAIPQLRDAVAEAGRDPADLEIIPFGSVPTPEKLEHFAAIGVTECVFRLPSADRDEVLRILDGQASLLSGPSAG